MVSNLYKHIHRHYLAIVNCDFGWVRSASIYMSRFSAHLFFYEMKRTEMKERKYCSFVALTRVWKLSKLMFVTQVQEFKLPSLSSDVPLCVTNEKKMGSIVLPHDSDRIWSFQMNSRNSRARVNVLVKEKRLSI